MSVVEFVRFGQLPSIRLRAPDGAQATVTMFGAQVVSWIPAGGTEQLFCSRRSALDGSKAIRGGIPIIFPQFAERGEGTRHGFARLSHWRLMQSGFDNGAGFAEFALTSNDHPPSNWPFDFALAFRVAIHGSELDLTLHVQNIGQHPFSFAAALHTYFLIKDISSVAIDGLEHTSFSEGAASDNKQTARLLTCPDKLDRIYYRTPSDLTLSSSGAKLVLSQEGFVDAVVWNPGAEDAAAMSDLAHEEFRQFICVEPAHIEPCQLEPGNEWLGRHTMRCSAGIS